MELEDREEEYECQFYCFSTSDVVTRITNSMDVIMAGLIKSISNKLTNIMTQEEIESAKRSFLASYNESLVQHQAQLRSIVKTFLGIKSNILLEQDRCQSVQYTPEYEKQVEQEVENSKCQLRALVVLESRLRQCLKNILNEETLMNSLKAQFQHIVELRGGLESLQESTAKLPQMEELCKTLKEKLDF
ncbi:uncharacterized protein LOC106667937 [Cimex lectularius]|uniref:Protein MIS12 homolog n=1 Tax=Cimex lectularius TaxID=79782 RepID=A0A8I6RSK2_CIMLE|nr:uncharacterized protein LOC106667937 [Cimex lectularius]